MRASIAGGAGTGASQYGPDIADLRWYLNTDAARTQAARTRLKNVTTLDFSSCAREDICADKFAISLKAAALRPAACSTDEISVEALAVYCEAVCILVAISRVVVACSSTADAMTVALAVSCSITFAIDEISPTDFLVESWIAAT